jgi:sugar phosphate isomerase/epimerase
MASCIGAQLFTVREFTQTPEDIAKTLQKIRDIGYEAVQVSAVGPIDKAELRKILDDNGLVCAATHIGFPDMVNDFDRVVAEHETLGCVFPAIGGMPGEYRSGDGFHQFAKDASDVARKFKEHGMTFGYHNHSFELEKFAGVPGLEILMNESDPAVTFEIDTYWIQHGGGSPAAWIRKASGRIPLLHLKDMCVLEGKPAMAEIGQGNLDWPAILAAAKDAGTQWYLIEQDVCQRDPFDSLKMSLEYVKSLGLA